MNSALKIIKTSIVTLAVAFGTASCSTGSVPQEGYNKYKDQMRDYYKSLGGTGDEIRFDSCSYAYIIGDRIYEADSYKGSVFYYITYTITIDNRSQWFERYPVYFSEIDKIVDSDANNGTQYYVAVSSIKKGSYTGKIGTL